MADTIYALSSGHLPCGVAVVRVSGAGVRGVVHHLCGQIPPVRQAVLKSIHSRNGELIDQGLVLYFAAPHSYTGEDVAEFQLHGSRAVVARFFQELSKFEGCRAARRGEFTQRAYENGRLSLHEVEGLQDLIASESQFQRQQALRHISGDVDALVSVWQKKLLQACALVDAVLEFPDEGDVGQESLEEAFRFVCETKSYFERCLASTYGEKLRDGFTVAVVGEPNVGKSSLINALARREVAIVSDMAGTTRDVLEVHMDLDGLPVTFLDTAGLRETDHPVEKEGIARALKRAEQADLVLVVLDHPDSAQKGSNLLVDDFRSLAVVSKSDIFDSIPKYSNFPGCFVSSVTGYGLSALLEKVSDILLDSRETEFSLIQRERHRNCILQAHAALVSGCSSYEIAAYEVFSDCIKHSLRSLDQYIGLFDVEQVLDEIFSSFCIGK